MRNLHLDAGWFEFIRRFGRGGERNKAFTLIELMMVVAIIAALATIAVPSFASYRIRAQVAVCITAMDVIEKAVEGYWFENSRYPDSLTDVNLDTLKDPWGNPFQYLRIADQGKKMTGKSRKDHFMVPINTDFDLYSMGPDGQSVGPLTAKASQDDVIRANDGGFVGIASRY